MIGIAVIIKQMKKTKTIGNLIDIEILTCFTCLFNEEGGGESMSSKHSTSHNCLRFLLVLRCLKDTRL